MRAIRPGAFGGLTLASAYWIIRHHFRPQPSKEAMALHLTPDPSNPLKPTPVGLRLLSLVDTWEQTKDKSRGSLSPANWLICDKYANQLAEIRALPSYTPSR